MLNKNDDCFRCHCCSGLPDGGMDQNLIDVLNEAGITAEEITNGYRCPPHNAEVDGSASQSRHMYGDAADVAGTIHSPDELFALFEALGADGIHAYNDDRNICHVDCRDGRKDGGYRW